MISPPYLSVLIRTPKKEKRDGPYKAAPFHKKVGKPFLTTCPLCFHNILPHGG